MCPHTVAPSHVALAVGEAGLVASQAEKAKAQKYALLDSSHHFVPFAIETSGPRIWARGHVLHQGVG